LHVDFPLGSFFRVLELDARYAALVAEHFVEHVIVKNFHVAGAAALDELVDHDLLGAKLIAAVHDSHARRNIRQIQGFLDGRVAAADHRDGLVTEEKAVARRAS
jgi:hypothetical protein